MPVLKSWAAPLDNLTSIYSNFVVYLSLWKIFAQAKIYLFILTQDIPSA